MCLRLGCDLGLVHTLVTAASFLDGNCFEVVLAYINVEEVAYEVLVIYSCCSCKLSLGSLWLQES